MINWVNTLKQVVMTALQDTLVELAQPRQAPRIQTLSVQSALLVVMHTTPTHSLGMIFRVTNVLLANIQLLGSTSV
jgi:hypothetical protein